GLRGELVLDAVRFAYPSLTPLGPRSRPRGPADPRWELTAAQPATAKPPEALRGVSLTVGAGESVALVGQTGAGKSTVMKLIARFYDPDSGAVTIDGHDLRTLQIQGYRTQLGYVPQE